VYLECNGKEVRPDKCDKGSVRRTIYQGNLRNRIGRKRWVAYLRACLAVDDASRPDHPAAIAGGAAVGFNFARYANRKDAR
jgi:hypothetical protein